MPNNIIKSIAILIITSMNISCGSSNSDELVSFSNNIKMKLSFAGSCDESLFTSSKRASDDPNYQELIYTCKNLTLNSDAACLITAEVNEISGAPSVGSLINIETSSYGSDGQYPSIQGLSDVNGIYSFSISLSRLCGYGYPGGRSNLTSITASVGENESLPSTINIIAPDDGY